MLNVLFREYAQHQIVHKRQTIHPAASIADTLVHSAVTVYSFKLAMKKNDDRPLPCRSSTPMANPS